MSFHVPERIRVTSGPMGSDARFGNNGLFILPPIPGSLSKARLRCIASDGLGWEHVSVSLPMRCPTWTEMAAVKALFWDPEDCVLQFHPPESQYVNNYPFCLHLWRQIGGKVALPPSILTGIKELGEVMA